MIDDTTHRQWAGMSAGHKLVSGTRDQLARYAPRKRYSLTRAFALTFAAGFALCGFALALYAL